jgi:hypothetical protein
LYDKLVINLNDDITMSQRLSAVKIGFFHAKARLPAAFLKKEKAQGL